MKVRGWQIDGFGIFHEHAVDDLPDGLTLFHGPNEAGKSTLLAFLRGVLFGFPDRRRKQPQYPPLRGGQHGGRIELEEEGQRFTIAREAGKRLAAEITLPGGGIGVDDDLRRLLGGADETLFSSVFAFSLTELQSFDSLSRDEVRERIFAAGIAGAGRSARQALDLLEKRSGDLLRPRGKCRFVDLLHDLRALDKEIQEAKRSAGAYAEIIESEERADRQVQTLREESGTLDDRRERLVLLTGLWPTWLARQAADETLDAFAATPLGSAVLAAAPEAIELGRRLDRDLPLHRQRCEELERKRLRLEQLEIELERQLRELGPGWDAARVAACDASVARRQEIRNWADRLRAAGNVLERATLELEQSVRQRETREKERDGLIREIEQLNPDSSDSPATEPIPDSATLESLESALQRVSTNRAELGSLRQNLASIDTTAQSLERTLRLHQADESWTPPPRLPWILWSVAALAAGWLIAQLVRHSLDGWPVTVLLIAVAGRWLLGEYTRRTRRREELRRDGVRSTSVELESHARSRSDTSEQITELSARLADDAARLGLSPELTAQEIGDRAAALARQRESRRRIDDLHGRLTDAERLLAAERNLQEQYAGQLAEAREADAHALAQWQAWLATDALPVDATPGQVLDLFDLLHRCRETLGQRDELRAHVAQLQDTIAAWEDQAGQLVGVGGAEQPSAELSERPSAKLASQFATWMEAATRGQELERELHAVEQQLTARIGAGAAAAEIRATLATGEIEPWRREATALDRRLDELRLEDEAAIEARTEARQTRQQLEGSADIARREIERAVLVEQLSNTAEEWRVTSLATGLIAGTLREFERTRQPAVLAAASELFATVTAGRYTRLVQDEGGAAISILDERQRRKAVDDLSRGTAEQLYLCLRLGLAAEFARRSTELPLVMDDVLVNFDPERARRMASVLAGFSREHQLLLFTCHPQTRDLLLAADPRARVIELQSGSDGNDAGQQQFSL